MRFSKKFILPPVLALFLIGIPAFSQENNGPKPDSIFIISSFDFSIKGRTRPDAVINKGGFREGEEIRGQENLEKYIRDKTQILLNERVLEKVSIDYAIGQKRDDGKFPVSLYIDLEDSWNFIVLPYPKYSSNTGFELTLKARDYNFLGTMNPLRIDLGYTYDDNERNTLFAELDSNTPFKAFGYNWYFRFNHLFKYRFEREEPFYYKNITGIAVELPVKTTTLTLGFEESVIINEENGGSEKETFGEFQKGLYLSSNPYFSWGIPTGLEIGEYGALVYTPSASFTMNHELSSDWPLTESRKGPYLNAKHSLGFGRIDWIGNFRKGFDAYIDNSYGYDFYRASHEQDALTISYSVSGTGHFIFKDFFGASARLQFRQWFNHDGYNDQAGDVLRGIRSDAVHADYMLSLNLDFPIRVFRFLPSQWFKKPKMHIIDFDLHLSPIIDLAMYHDPVGNVPFDITNMIASGGIELIVFPAIMRSLFLRASFAYSFVDHIHPPPKVSGGKNYEIFIGMGHHY